MSLSTKWSGVLLVILRLSVWVVAILPRREVVYNLDSLEDRLVKADFKIYASGHWSMADCTLYGDRVTIKRVIAEAQHHQIQRMNPADMRRKIEKCISMQRQTIYNLEDFYAIYPGTKWCGAGNIAEDGNDLGKEEETDVCCRDHDYCDDNIEKYQTKHGLYNPDPYTRSHCDCDARFYKCLKNARSSKASSHQIGNLYFNFLQIKCFNFTHPIERCLSHHDGLLSSSCQEYKLDETKDPIWQFFDAKYFDH